MVEIARRPSAADIRRKKSIAIWAFLLLPVLLIFTLPTVILLGVGMLPTVAAAVIDRRPEKYAAYCVGGFNLAGVTPFMVQLWFSGNAMQELTRTIADPLAWLIMYGAAGFGWLCFSWVPDIVLRITSFRERQRVIAMQHRQQELVDEWGPEVMPPMVDESFEG